MQALIDFDGWRKWKDFSQTPASTGPNKTIAANDSNNVSGGGVVASNNTTKESPTTKVATASGGGGVKTSGAVGVKTSGAVGGTKAALMERKTQMTRKDKRSSLGASIGVGGLSGVSEDGDESGGGMIIAAGA